MPPTDAKISPCWPEAHYRPGYQQGCQRCGLTPDQIGEYWAGCDSKTAKGNWCQGSMGLGRACSTHGPFRSPPRTLADRLDTRIIRALVRNFPRDLELQKICGTREPYEVVRDNRHRETLRNWAISKAAWLSDAELLDMRNVGITGLQWARRLAPYRETPPDLQWVEDLRHMLPATEWKIRFTATYAIVEPL